MGDKEVEVRQLAVDDERVFRLHAVLHESPRHLAQQVALACTPLSHEHFDEAVARVSRNFVRISASLVPEVKRGGIPQVVFPERLQFFVHNRLFYSGKFLPLFLLKVEQLLLGFYFRTEFLL